MKKKYYIFSAIACYFLFLAAKVPANYIIHIISDNAPFKIQSASGTIWSGKAHRISINNKVQLEDTEWSFNLWKLPTGRIAIDINTEYSGNNIQGELGSSFLGRYFINNLSATIPAKDIAELAGLPLAQLAGFISLDIENAYWKRGELPMASGRINWNNAAVTIADTASLGNILITLGESEQQLLHADVKNQGGDIKISGTADLVPEADYAVNINLAPAASANSSIEQSLAMFAKKQGNGSYLFTKTGPLNQIGSK